MDRGLHKNGFIGRCLDVARWARSMDDFFIFFVFRASSTPIWTGASYSWSTDLRYMQKTALLQILISHPIPARSPARYELPCVFEHLTVAGTVLHLPAI
jgi:hypothetical protein